MRQCLYTMLLLLTAAAAAQDVARCTGWLASVDEATQQIVLTWHPSPDSNAWGYHICTGSPCLNYDTVFGRMDTTYVCADHDPLERHVYRLHVFDSNHNASALTPFFGNMVLTATVPECETEVYASWTPYTGMPTGQPRYTLWVRLEPFDEDYDQYYSTADSTALHRSIDISEGVTRVWMKVEAEGEGGYHSWSNVVQAERRTADRASFIEITDIAYDSIERVVSVGCLFDDTFIADHYTLYRSIDGSPMRKLADFSTRQSHYTYTDRNINVYDSLHCYQLGVKDACGMNEQYSHIQCVVVPTPPPPAAAFPNTILCGDPDNGCFRPVLRGLMGNLYELDIYNHMGLLVFSTEDPDEGWTPGGDTPQGVYVYHLRCRFNTGAIKSYTGSVTLIK